MSKITVDIEQFSALIPYLIGIFSENPELASDDSEEFYSRISKKVKTDIRQHIRSTPDARRQFKLIKDVFEDGGSNAVIQIKAEKEANEHDNITQYLT